MAGLVSGLAPVAAALHTNLIEMLKLVDRPLAAAQWRRRQLFQSSAS